MDKALFALALILSAPGGRVINLPEESNKWYVTVVYSDQDNMTARDQQLHELLRTPPYLTWTQQVIFTEWDNKTEYLRQSSWSGFIGSERPAILVQAPARPNGTGDVVFFSAGQYLKIDETLAPDLAKAVQGYRARNSGELCPRCPKQPVEPQPSPEPGPDPNQIPIIVPGGPVEPEVPVEPSDKTSWVFFLLPLLGALAGAYKKFKEEAGI